MGSLGKNTLYRHCGVALLRAAVMPMDELPDRWPDLADTEDCRDWLRLVWGQSWLIEAIRMASPGLAERLDAICASKPIPARQVRRATTSTIRYLLRAAGRHTPFGLFAGVAPVTIGTAAKVQWAKSHEAVARVDTEWLADVVDQLEACPELLDGLDVVFSNLATRRGSRLEAPRGPNRASIRYTSAVECVHDAAASPIQFGVLVDKLIARFPDIGAPKTRSLLTSLVQQGFLISCLRAPLTVTEPLAHLVDRLNDVDADAVPTVAPMLQQLVVIQSELNRHNQASAAERVELRSVLAGRMRELSVAGRTPLAMDLRLDCDVQLPEHVAEEIAAAASALIRLSRQPTGEAVWRDYYTAFCERYGTGTLVPLADVVHPDGGIGLPYGYPGSTMPPPRSGPSKRDGQLLSLAWQAMVEGRLEIVLTDEIIESLTVGDAPTERNLPPHVELAARIHAVNVEALDRGGYTLTVAPARSMGTLTGRFTTITASSGLTEVYEAVPTSTEGALPVQLSFPPIFPHAENICRVPPYLPHLLSLDEHRAFDEPTIPVEDLAITASRNGLHLVSLSRRRVLEPQVFHALALEKQPPPLARFLAHLARGLSVAWTEFDWGPTARELPYLPRIRYQRSVLSPARWRLNAGDIPDRGNEEWRDALQRWRQRWGCPETVELRDADRSLPLTLTEPAHAAIVGAHLRRQGDATFTETATADDLGWIDGHAHDVVAPLVAIQQPARSPLSTPRPVITNAAHGQLPGAADAGWLYAKLYTHPERMNEIIADHLPQLLRSLGDEPDYWFIRYRSAHEPDHLRLRIQTSNHDQPSAYVSAVGRWVQQLRNDRLAGRLVFDTYYPEVGRYGEGSAMRAAENVFAADSRVVAVQLRQLPAGLIHPCALAALNMVATVQGFLGGLDIATEWLTKRPAPRAIAERSVTDELVELVRHGLHNDLLEGDGEVADSWQARAEALAAYRGHLTVATDTSVDSSADARADAILEALLHMHHNRALGIDRDSEVICRRLARQATLAWTARHGGGQP